METPGFRGLSPEQIRRAFGEVVPFLVPSTDGTTTIAGCLLDDTVSLPPHWCSLPSRSALSLMAANGGEILDGGGLIGRFFRVYHIMQWRRESVFCGSCGTRNGDAPVELARLCPSCGRLEYPRISPAIIVLILRDDGKALLAHNKKFAGKVYSLIAGFTEAGENLEAAVGREVREEVGLEVRDTTYVASQPWPFPNSLMIGFKTRYAGGTITPDGEEIEDARWFRRDELPDLPGFGSVSRYLINLWIEGRL
ncbi:NAD(+) diphosphatase [Treponema sp. TIM-1]|uniref:NAD(+) diphosphatase n=1 Tax=Treponema sp. TIM-1 TaxID=2898417 RepID=UPI00397FEE5E